MNAKDGTEVQSLLQYEDITAFVPKLLPQALIQPPVHNVLKRNNIAAPFVISIADNNL